jgi:hypothetical protein
MLDTENWLSSCTSTSFISFIYRPPPSRPVPCPARPWSCPSRATRTSRPWPWSLSHRISSRLSSTPSPAASPPTACIPRISPVHHAPPYLRSPSLPPSSPVSAPTQCPVSPCLLPPLPSLSSSSPPPLPLPLPPALLLHRGACSTSTLPLLPPPLRPPTTALSLHPSAPTPRRLHTCASPAETIIGSVTIDCSTYSTNHHTARHTDRSQTKETVHVQVVE